jgi:lipopolysaccharide transport system ATP-binding protein
MNSIRVSGLGKAYKQYPTRWSRLVEWMMPFGGPRHRLKWVLQDIDVEIGPGEAVGIVGVNGAGKSTLLKIITGTVQPTTGKVMTTGRVAALLELGMGFHPDFTGRQNAFLSGQLMGLSLDEIAGLMPQIEAFAGIGDYIDQPVRIYSSGMQVRLAFSVATAVRPDILIVDEALAVGDAAFQRKCFQRIEMFRAAGTTLLFVSHDIGGVKKLCSRALFLKDGRLELFDSAKKVCDAYEKYLFGVPPQSAIERNDEMGSLTDHVLSAAAIEMTYGDASAQIDRFAIRDSRGDAVNVITERMPFSIHYDVRFGVDCEDIVFGMMIKTVDGVCVYSTNTERSAGIRSFAAGDIAQVTFALENNLAPGTYYLNCGVSDATAEDRVFLHRRVDIAILRSAGAADPVNYGLANLYARPDIAVSRGVRSEATGARDESISFPGKR